MDAKRVRAILFGAFDLRTIVLLVVAAALLSIDWVAARAFGFGLGLVTAALAFVHWYRKLAHPYLDIEKAAAKAQEDSLGAALIVLGVFGLVAVVLIFLLFVVVR